MSTDEILLGLRLLTGVLVLGFLGTLFWVLWRDFRAVTGLSASGQQRYGRLVVMEAGQDGVEIGASFPLLPLTSLGRGATNTIVLEDTFCSQEHALVTRRGGQWWLEDRRSSNGTRLNGQPVEEPVVVSSGDVIGVGQVALKIEME